MRWSSSSALLVALLVGLVTFGCRERPPAGFDAGPRPDAGLRRDAGTRDGGADRDGGEERDGGTAFDGGGSQDGGSRDGGSRDGGSRDAGMGRDAGPDSGPPTTCPDQDLGSATGESVASGTLDGTWNDVRPSCAEIMNGEELIYGWTAPSAGEWVFDTIGSEVDTVMAIHTGASCPGTEVACNDDANEAIQSSVRRTLTAGQEIWIVVDEYRNLEFGTFQLNVHTGVPTLESSCDDGLDEDRDGAADCGDRDCASAAGC